jgi:alpha-L-rhamnosidase
MLENGATTLWEHWEFSDNTYSHNHPMFGSVSEWFYKALAGINPAPDAVGFDRIVLEPRPEGDLSWVRASYDSVRGPIVSDWKRSETKFEYRVRVPVGVTATVRLPATAKEQVTESGHSLDRAEGVQFRGIEGSKAVVEVGTGEYKFTISGKRAD